MTEGNNGILVGCLETNESCTDILPFLRSLCFIIYVYIVCKNIVAGMEAWQLKLHPHFEEYILII